METIGTCNFVSFGRLCMYYRRYEPYMVDKEFREWMKVKIGEGSVEIGKPNIKEGEELILLDKGCRYGIQLKATGEERTTSTVKGSRKQGDTLNIQGDTIEALKTLNVVGDLAYLGAQLGRKEYLEVKKALELAGCKYLTGKKAFKMPNTNTVQDIISNRSVVDKKKKHQFFETPKEISKRLVELADIKKTSVVMEPSAGHGSIVREILKQKPKRLIANEYDKGKEKELYQAMETETRGSVDHTITFKDFMDVKISQKEVDIFIANPPFSRKQDIDHVNKMLSFNPRAVVAIMSAGTLHNTDKKTTAFRDKITTLGGEFIELEEGDFKESGTNVKTVILILKDLRK